MSYSSLYLTDTIFGINILLFPASMIAFIVISQIIVKKDNSSFYKSCIYNSITAIFLSLTFTTFECISWYLDKYPFTLFELIFFFFTYFSLSISIAIIIALIFNRNTLPS